MITGQYILQNTRVVFIRISFYDKKLKIRIIETMMIQYNIIAYIIKKNDFIVSNNLIQTDKFHKKLNERNKILVMVFKKNV